MVVAVAVDIVFIACICFVVSVSVSACQPTVPGSIAACLFLVVQLERMNHDKMQLLSFLIKKKTKCKIVYSHRLTNLVGVSLNHKRYKHFTFIQYACKQQKKATKTKQNRKCQVWSKLIAVNRKKSCVYRYNKCQAFDDNKLKIWNGLSCLIVSIIAWASNSTWQLIMIHLHTQLYDYIELRANVVALFFCCCCCST